MTDAVGPTRAVGIRHQVAQLVPAARSVGQRLTTGVQRVRRSVGSAESAHLGSEDDDGATARHPRCRHGHRAAGDGRRRRVRGRRCARHPHRARRPDAVRCPRGRSGDGCRGPARDRDARPCRHGACRGRRRRAARRGRGRTRTRGDGIAHRRAARRGRCARTTSGTATTLRADDADGRCRIAAHPCRHRGRRDAGDLRPRRPGACRTASDRPARRACGIPSSAADERPRRGRRHARPGGMGVGRRLLARVEGVRRRRAARGAVHRRDRARRGIRGLRRVPAPLARERHQRRGLPRVRRVRHVRRRAGRRGLPRRRRPPRQGARPARGVRAVLGARRRARREGVPAHRHAGPHRTARALPDRPVRVARHREPRVLGRLRRRPRRAVRGRARARRRADPHRRGGARLRRRRLGLLLRARR